MSRACCSWVMPQILMPVCLGLGNMVLVGKAGGIASGQRQLFIRQNARREAEQGVQLWRVTEAAAKADVALDGLQCRRIAAAGDENDRRCRVAAGMCQRISPGNQTVQHVPSEIRQSDGQNHELIGTGDGQLEGPLTGRAVIHLTMTKGNQGLANDPAIGQALLS